MFTFAEQSYLPKVVKALIMLHWSGSQKNDKLWYFFGCCDAYVFRKMNLCSIWFKIMKQNDVSAIQIQNYSHNHVSQYF